MNRNNHTENSKNSRLLSKGHPVHPDPLELLAKLADHPDGLQLASLVCQLYKEVKPNAEPDNQLVAKAMSIAQNSGKRTPRYVKNMTNDELEAWIAENS